MNHEEYEIDYGGCGPTRPWTLIDRLIFVVNDISSLEQRLEIEERAELNMMLGHTNVVTTLETLLEEVKGKV